MAAKLIELTREQLISRRREILSQLGEVRLSGDGAAQNVMTPDERELMIELGEVDFLLGDGE
jgi:hypothetical protein